MGNGSSRNATYWKALIVKIESPFVFTDSPTGTNFGISRKWNKSSNNFVFLAKLGG